MRRFLVRLILLSVIAVSARAQEATLRMAVGGPYAPVRALAITPDGSRMFIGGGFDFGPYTPDRRVGDGKIFDVTTLGVVASLSGLNKPVFSAAFSKDGRLLVTGGGIPDDDRPGQGELCLWDAKTGELLRRFYGVMPVRAVSFSPDGAWVIVRSPSNVTFWQTATGSMVDNVDTGAWSACTISPSGDHYAIAYGEQYGTARVVNTELRVFPYRAVVRRYTDTTDDVTAIAFSKNGKRLATVTGDTIRIRLLETSIVERVLVKPGARITSLAFSDDDAYIAAGEVSSGLVYLWRLATGEMLFGHEAAPRGAFGFHDKPIRSVHFLPDGRLISGADDHTARIWTVPDGRHVRSLTAPHRERVTSLSFSPNGQWLATVAHDSSILIWDTQNLRPLLSLPTILAAPIQRVQFLPDNDAIAVIAGNVLYRVSTFTGAPVSYGSLVAGAATAISADGRFVAVGSGPIGDGPMTSRVTVHELASGTPIIRTFDLQEDSVTSVAFTRDGSTILATSRGAAYAWEVSTGKLAWRRVVPICLIASTGGEELMMTGKTATVHDLSTGDSLRSIATGATIAAGMTLTSDGAYALAVDARGTLRRWEAASGDTLPDARSGFPFSSVAVSVDSRQVAAAAFDGTIALWSSGLSLSPASAPQTADMTRQRVRLAPVLASDGGVGIGYVLPEEGPVTVELFDMAGTRVRSLASGVAAAGEHQLDIPSDLPAGMYVCRMTTGREMVGCVLPIGL